MSKVLVDRELLNSALKTIHGMAPGRFTVEEELRAAVTAKPAEAEGSIQRPASHPAECYAPGTHVVHASLVHGIVRQADELNAALSAVTAERDRLESMLIQTTTRHFAKQWKDRADDKKLDECLSEGIAMLEAERDQYRDMAACMDLLRRDLIEAGVVGESCPPMFMTEGVLAYIAKLRTEAGGWIPLAESTPPDGVPVLRWPGWAAEISIDEWCNDYGCFLMSIEEGERATHWKPISAPAAMAAKEA